MFQNKQKGNGGEDGALNLCAGDAWDKKTWTSKVFSQWGNDVIYGSYGIKNTSQRASIF